MALQWPRFTRPGQAEGMADGWSAAGVLRAGTVRRSRGAAGRPDLEINADVRPASR